MGFGCAGKLDYFEGEKNSGAGTFRATASVGGGPHSWARRLRRLRRLRLRRLRRRDMSSVEMPASLELQGRASDGPEVERSTPRAAEGDEKVAYDKRRGEDQWPEFAEEQSFSTRAIQYISNHSGAHERSCLVDCCPVAWFRALPRCLACRRSRKADAHTLCPC